MEDVNEDEASRSEEVVMKPHEESREGAATRERVVVLNTSGGVITGFVALLALAGWALAMALVLLGPRAVVARFFGTAHGPTVAEALDATAAAPSLTLGSAHVASGNPPLIAPAPDAEAPKSEGEPAAAAARKPAKPAANRKTDREAVKDEAVGDELEQVIVVYEIAERERQKRERGVTAEEDAPATSEK